MLDDPRSAWTDRGPAHPLHPWGSGNPRGVAYHYIGGNGYFTPQNHDGCLAWVRNIEALEESGGVGTHDVYSALSYNLCACPHGRVIEGRGVDFQSGAQLHGNENYVAILCMMNIMDGMTEPIRRAATAAREYVLLHYPDAREQLGHRDVADNPTGTACPGNAVEMWIQAGGANQPPPPPVYPKPDPTTYREVGDVAQIKQVTVSLVLDGDGHGWKDVPQTLKEGIVGTFVHMADPPTVKGYMPIPAVGFADVPGHPHIARVVLSGGWPHGKYAVSVNSV